MVKSRKKINRPKKSRKINKSKNSKKRKSGGSLFSNDYYTKNEEWGKECKKRLSQSALKSIGKAPCDESFCGKYINKQIKKILGEGVKKTKEIAPSAIPNICKVLGIVQDDIDIKAGIHNSGSIPKNYIFN